MELLSVSGFTSFQKCRVPLFPNPIGNREQSRQTCKHILPTNLPLEPWNPPSWFWSINAHLLQLLKRNASQLRFLVICDAGRDNFKIWHLKMLIRKSFPFNAFLIPWSSHEESLHWMPECQKLSAPVNL